MPNPRSEIFFIDGELTHDTVMNEWCAVCALDWERGVRVFDLSRVTQCDSAGVAFLLALRREAKRQEISLSFQGVPPMLRALAEVNGVTELLF